MIQDLHPQLVCHPGGLSMEDTKLKRGSFYCYLLLFLETSKKRKKGVPPLSTNLYAPSNSILVRIYFAKVFVPILYAEDAPPSLTEGESGEDEEAAK